MTKLLTVHGYAKLRGLHHRAIQKAIEDGRIHTVKGPGGRPMIDQEKADAELDANTDPSKPKGRKGITGPKPAQYDENKQRNGVPSFADSAAIEKAYKARLAKIEYEQKAGKLIEVAQVESAWLSIITTAKSKILSIPSKAKAEIPELTLTNIATIERLVRECLEDLANESNR